MQMDLIMCPDADGMLVPPANGLLALFSPQLDALRDRFPHLEFDAWVRAYLVCGLI